MENFVPLTQEETLELVKLAKTGDEEAKEKLIEGNFPLIKSIIRKYVGRGVDYDDLYQLGCVGFLKAIKNFDQAFDVKFTTYAVPMIAGEVKRYMRDDGDIKISRAIKTLTFKIKSFIDEYKKEHDEEPTIEILERHFDVPKEDIVCALDSSKPMISLYAKIDESGENSAHILDKIVTEDKSDVLLDNLLLKQAISELEDREKKIILLRYFRGRTQSEVACELGVSQVQVSRLESKIIERFKKKLIY
ncbi:MAG: SigB/SigF/SigG family RNA polymerase sigma factor [Clostridia bacterium]|nr:SigB/SigF/SigG family RNA polymerase sigma factor [Clostridia bacterium]